MIWKKSRVRSKLSVPSALTALQNSPRKYAYALVSPALFGLIAWGIILIVKESEEPSRTNRKQEKSNAELHIISVKQ